MSLFHLVITAITKGINMGIRTNMNLDKVRQTIARYTSDGHNVVVAVNFREGTVEEIIPVRLNRNGECMNFESILAELECAGCEPRKLSKQTLPRVYDSETIIVFQEKIA